MDKTNAALRERVMQLELEVEAERVSRRSAQCSAAEHMEAAAAAERTAADLTEQCRSMRQEKDVAVNEREKAYAVRDEAVTARDNAVAEEVARATSVERERVAQLEQKARSERDKRKAAEINAKEALQQLLDTTDASLRDKLEDAKEKIAWLERRVRELEENVQLRKLRSVGEAALRSVSRSVSSRRSKRTTGADTIAVMKKSDSSACSSPRDFSLQSSPTLASPRLPPLPSPREADDPSTVSPRRNSPRVLDILSANSPRRTRFSRG